MTVPIPECLDAVQSRAVSGAEHGTIVAESVVDMASEVSLYIANPQSKGDLQDAVDWMVSEGVAVINYSVGWTFDGPGDGTSPLSVSPLNTVDRAVARDIIWVNSAGNSARNTWFGAYSDPNSDGIISFGGGNDEVLGMPGRACRRNTIQLRWDDNWDGASTDLDLHLYDKSTGEVVFSSADEQSGQRGHVPFEGFWYMSRNDRDDLGIVVEHFGGDAPDWIQLVVWGPGSIQHYTKNGSITNPAESANPGMLAVGAAHWNDVRAIEPYSSRGPTPDSRRRVKPDIVGAACGATALRPLNEYNNGFCGTSQAAPHVAGLAALVKQRFPTYTPVQVAAYLKDNAAQRQSPDPNNTWGHGFAQLPPPDGVPPTAPAPSNSFTRNPAADFNGLISAGNIAPRGIWSDGTTIWVADSLDDKIYAYDLATKARTPGRDFDTLGAAGNTWPEGIWSDGTTMWVSDWFDDKIYAYDMATKARVPGKDFGTLIADDNPFVFPGSIWSDGTTMWVADTAVYITIFAYDMVTKARVSGKDFDSLNARNQDPEGIWSDGETMWVADDSREKIYAYNMATKARVPDKEFNTLEAVGNYTPRGIWSDGTTMWVADWDDEKIYAYHMPQVESAADRAALVVLYNATGGANWTNKTNWMTNTPIGQWYGVTTDASGRVTNLDLNDNQLSGTIPTQLGNLANLEGLHLTRNQLTGTIPAELGGLTSLEILALGGNQLTGTIPPWLGSLANLEELYLWGNDLTGTIPAELGSLADLQELHLGSNQLTGEIPVELGSLANLQGLHLTRNRLNGEIPPELARLTSLEILALGGNDFTGPIPNWLGSLANLEELYLWGNELTGTIPAELGSLANLVQLQLSGNQLTGEIPVELGRLTNLEVLYLWDNQLSGMVPQTLAGLTMLESFVFYSNLGLCAPIDEAFQTWLEGISIVYGSSCAPADSPEDRAVLVKIHSATDGTNWTNSDNWLSEEHSIREWYGVTSDATGRVHGLFLGSNQLTGEIPAELESLANLEGVSLSQNQLSGEIPSELGSLANLRLLSLRDNQLTGEIPPELGSLANLERLRLHNNQLTGEIPAELGRLTNLTVLYLAGNQLTGCVPASLRNVEDNDFAQLGLTFCAPGDPLVARYDDPANGGNGNGIIDRSEVIKAINDYLFGEGDQTITRADVIKLINLYLFGPPTAQQSGTSEELDGGGQRADADRPVVESPRWQGGSRHHRLPD